MVCWNQIYDHFGTHIKKKIFAQTRHLSFPGMECFWTIFQVDLQRAAFPPETSDQRNETAVVLGESSFQSNLF
jgi:hypothetical protein